MKTIKIVNTEKANEITKYCNALLNPAKDYFKKAPEAIVDEKWNLSFNFVFKISSQSISPTLTIPICSVGDVEDGADLCWAVGSKLAMSVHLYDALWDVLNKFSLDPLAVDEVWSTINEVFPQIAMAFSQMAFSHEACQSDEKKGAKVFCD